MTCPYPHYRADCIARYALTGHTLSVCPAYEDCPGPDAWNGEEKPPEPQPTTCPHWHGRCDLEAAVAALVRVATREGEG